MIEYRYRRAFEKLVAWGASPVRKPLLLRGARQVGKSSLVRAFGERFDHYVELNLERPRDARLFATLPEARPFVRSLLIRERLSPREGERTLLFIDEIQQAPAALQFLRYLYEDTPEIYVIAAGSLLEFSLGAVASFPVGRITMLAIHPLDFEEFLVWTGREGLVDALREIPLDAGLHDIAREAYGEYARVGGMPGVVALLADGHAWPLVLQEYASIWDSYVADIERYGRNPTQRAVLRHVISAVPGIHDRFNYAKFGGSDYRGREVKEALQALDMAKVVRLISATTQTEPPIVADLRVKPRLQLLDIGLLNYAIGALAEPDFEAELTDTYRGRLGHQAATQALIALHDNPSYEPVFWVRENRSANAELDLLYQRGLTLFPIEVKAGAKGRLRSLHEYLQRSGPHFAIRVLDNCPSVEATQTATGHPYQLLNLPFYALTQLDAYIDWATK